MSTKSTKSTKQSHEGTRVRIVKARHDQSLVGRIGVIVHRDMKTATMFIVELDGYRYRVSANWLQFERTCKHCGRTWWYRTGIIPSVLHSNVCNQCFFDGKN